MPQPARLVGAESYGVLDGPWCMVHEPWPAWRGAGELGEQGAGELGELGEQGAGELGSWGAGELGSWPMVLGSSRPIQAPKP